MDNEYKLKVERQTCTDTDGKYLKKTINYIIYITVCNCKTIFTRQKLGHSKKQTLACVLYETRKRCMPKYEECSEPDQCTYQTVQSHAYPNGRNEAEHSTTESTAAIYTVSFASRNTLEASVPVAQGFALLCTVLPPLAPQAPRLFVENLQKRLGTVCITLH